MDGLDSALQETMAGPEPGVDIMPKPPAAPPVFTPAAAPVAAPAPKVADASIFSSLPVIDNGKPALHPAGKVLEAALQGWEMPGGPVAQQGNLQAGHSTPYGQTRAHIEQSPGSQWGTYQIPRKDQESFLHNLRAHQGVEIGHLRDPVMGSLYNMAKMAERDGYRLQIESGTDGRHATTSFHYAGEGVDVNLKDRKGNYLPPDITVKKGIEYGLQSGFGSMLDEYNHPSADSSGQHLHFAWGNEKIGNPGVHTFRRRTPGAPDYLQGFQGDEKATRSYAEAMAGKKQDFIPTQVETFAMANGIDAGIAARQAKQESNFNPHAVSPAGAFGVMQLMPATAAEVGNRHGWSVEDIKANPTLQIKVGMEYMSDMLKKYKGNYSQALAAYNAGPGTVDRFLAGKGSLPEETQAYVHGIMHDRDPAIADIPSAVKAIRDGGGMVQNPDAAKQFAHDHMNRLANAHAGLLGTMMNFGSDYAKQFTDPDSPGSFLYQKSWLKPTSKPEEAGALDYGAGVLNAGLDFMQDILHGLTMHITPKPQRFQEVNRMASSSTALTDKFLGLASGNAGSVLGGITIGEMAAVKLFGPLGIKGLLAGAGAGGGLMGGLAVGEGMRNVMGLGAIAFTDGFVSSMSDWMHGDFMPGSSAIDAIGHATAMGGFTASLGIATALLGAPLIGGLDNLMRGGAKVPGALAAEAAQSSTLRQMGLGGTLGVMGGIAGGVISNATGFSQAMYGQDISVPDSAFLGMFAGSIGAPAGFALQRKALQMSNPKLHEQLVQYGSKNAANFQKLHETLGGASPEILVNAVLEQVRIKGNANSFAAAEDTAGSLQNYITSTAEKLQIGRDTIKLHELESQSMAQGAAAMQKKISELSIIPEVQTYKRAMAEEQAGTQKLQQLTAQPSPDGNLPKQATLEQRRIEKARLEQELALKTNRPAVEQFRAMQQQYDETQPKLLEMQAKSAMMQDQFSRMEAGFNHATSLSQRVADVFHSSASAWKPEYGEFKQFVHDRLQTVMNSPNTMTTPWGMKNFNRDHHSGELNEFGHAAYRNWADALSQAALDASWGQGRLPDSLHILEGQMLKAHGLGPDSEIFTSRPTAGQRAVSEVSTLSSLQNGKLLTDNIPAAKMSKMLARSNLKWEMPKFQKDLKGGKMLNANMVARMLELEELSGKRQPVDPTGLLGFLGNDKPVPIPRVNSMEEFERQVLPLVKVARDAGANEIPILASKEVLQQIGEKYNWAKRESEFRAMDKELSDSLEAHQELVKSRSIMPGQGGRFTGDLSMMADPDYLANRIHSTMEDHNNKGIIAKAIRDRDYGVLNDIKRKSEDEWNRGIADLRTMMTSVRGKGAKGNTPGSDQEAVLGSDVNNLRLGLDQDPGVIKSPELDNAMEALASKTGNDFIALDRETEKGGVELMQSGINSNLEGRGPSDYKDVAGTIYGTTVADMLKAAKHLTSYMKEQFQQVLERDLAQIPKGELPKEKFLKDMVGVLEDHGKFAAFKEQYGDAGKSTLYYFNQIKGKVAEVFKAGNPDLENWMRAQVVPAFFPKAVQAHLDQLGTEGGRGLKTLLDSEEIRSFGTLENLQKEMISHVSKIKAKGYDPETFGNLPVNERIDILFDNKQGKSLSAAEMETADPKGWESLANKANRMTTAHLFTEFDPHPVEVMDRHLSSMFRATAMRRYINKMADIEVDVGGGIGTPRMLGFVTELKKGDPLPVAVTAKGKRESYRLLSDIAGYDRFEIKMNGKLVPSRLLAIHPDGFEFTAHTGLNAGNIGPYDPTNSFWKSYDRMASSVRSYSLMGGIVPFFRHMMMSSFSEMMLTPFRALGVHSSGRNLIDGTNKDYRLAVANAIRSGVNSRTMQQSTRTMLSGLIDAMGPEEAKRFLGVESNEALRTLQAIDRQDPNNKAALDSLGGWKKIAAEVLGAPVAVDNIFNSEMLFKSIEAGMIGGFYYRKALYSKLYEKDLMGIPAGPQRERALEQMASQVVNQQAGAMPQHQMNGRWAQAMKLGVMTPGWFLGKANMILDGLDGAIGLGQRKLGVANKDVAEMSSLLKGLGVRRKYENYNPVVKEAIRNRMALTIAGGLFAAFTGTQALSYMMHGHDTMTGNTPDKWFSVKMGDQFMSGLVPGHVRDIVEGLTGIASGKDIQIITDLINRNLMPLPKTVVQLGMNQDDFGKQIYGDYQGGLDAKAQKLKEMTGYMAGKFLNYEETLGYKPGTPAGDVLDDMRNGPGNTSPNSISSTTYALQSMGMHNSRDNYALTEKGSVQARFNLYKLQAMDKIKPYVQAARDADNPEQRKKLMAAAWSAATTTGRIRVVDTDLAKYVPNGYYSITREQFNNLVQRTFNPTPYAYQQAGSSAAGKVTRENIVKMLEAREGQDNNTTPQDGEEEMTQ